MEVYHQSATPTDTPMRQLQPYEYVVRPPIARLLMAIQQHCGLGGTIQPGVRQLAAWMNYASAGRIAPLLQQLAMDGWILYDGASGCITLVADSDPITARDQSDDAVITDGDRPALEAITDGDRSATEAITAGDHPGAITARDRAVRRPSALLQAITRRDRSTPRMEDHDLAAADQDSDTAAAHETLPCAAELITARDRPAPHPAAVVLAELGADPPIVAEILSAQPALTPSAILAQWNIAQEQERTGDARNARRLLFGTLRKPGGTVHGRQDLRLDPQHYAADDAYMLGDAASPTDPIRDRAERITPPTISTADFLFVMQQLAAGASDDQALDALAQRQARQRGRV